MTGRAARGKTVELDAVKRFYDRFGSRQDAQAFYEDAAVDELIAHAHFERARAVLEIGCGTGRLAQFLLRHRLLASASYTGLDVSDTMARLATARLREFGDRARVRLTDGDVPADLRPESVDRVVAAYVFDLLGDGALGEVLDGAHRVLAPGGVLAVVSICDGCTALSRIVMRGWKWAHRVAPVLTGYCRPLDLSRWLAAPQWEIEWRTVVTRFGIASEVVVARALKEVYSCAS